MLRSIPFHPKMNLNLSLSIFAISYIQRVFDNVNTPENLMRTGTEFISEISANNNNIFYLHTVQFSHLLISTSFDFHLFDFLVKGR